MFEWHVGWDNVYADLHRGGLGELFVSYRVHIEWVDVYVYGFGGCVVLVIVSY